MAASLRNVVFGNLHKTFSVFSSVPSTPAITRTLTHSRFTHHWEIHQKYQTQGCHVYPASSISATPPRVKINSSAEKFSRRQQTNCRSNKEVGTLSVGLLAFSLFGKKDKEEEDELTRTLKWAILHAHRGEIKEADEMYHKALHIVQARTQSGEWTREKAIQAQTHIYDSMANLALQAMQPQKAEKLFKETMVGLLEQGREKTDNAMVEISLKLSMIYAMLDKPSEAEAGYRFCLDTLENKVQEKGFKESDEDTLGLLGMSLNSYARYMLINKKYDIALEKLERSIEIAKHVLGPEHPQLAVLYSDAATILSMKGNHSVAKEYIEKAVDLGKKTGNPDLATFMSNFGIVSIELGNLEQAKRLCTDALSMAKQLDDKQTQKEAQTCLNRIKKKENDNKQST